MGLRILKLEKDALGFPGEFVINDEDEQKRLFKRIFAELKVDEQDVDIKYAQWQISTWKNQLLFPEDVSARVTIAKMLRCKSTSAIRLLTRKKVA